MELYGISAEPHLGHRVPFWLISLVAYVRPFTIVRNKWLNIPSPFQMGRIIFFPHPLPSLHQQCVNKGIAGKMKEC